MSCMGCQHPDGSDASVLVESVTAWSDHQVHTSLALAPHPGASRLAEPDRHRRYSWRSSVRSYSAVSQAPSAREPQWIA